ncbi:hypothetical protein BKA61DRAFT_719461 [Leptodontidium sp. MPI-SDFR-AT-0119]|nr:hypothetical protein BKA61DRAFT_719461 [Leptodontidium sp. MPI-SDFR-AT-0119]
MPNTSLGVDVITGTKSNPILAAFFELDGGSISTEPRPMPVPAEIEAQLADRLPRYIMPSICSTVAKMPMTVSKKTDRKSSSRHSLIVRPAARGHSTGQEYLKMEAFDKNGVDVTITVVTSP